jgi:hypothetical protein
VTLRPATALRWTSSLEPTGSCRCTDPCQRHWQTRCRIAVDAAGSGGDTAVEFARGSQKATFSAVFLMPAALREAADSSFGGFALRQGDISNEANSPQLLTAGNMWPCRAAIPLASCRDAVHGRSGAGSFSRIGRGCFARSWIERPPQRPGTLPGHLWSANTE